MATKFITVSIDVMHNKDFNQSQKFLISEIEQLSQLDKGCIASNQHFADLIGITKENVSRNLNDLVSKGYIDIEIVNGTRNHTRIITLTKVVSPPYQSSKPPLLKQQETKENKTSNKTINITLGGVDAKIWESWVKHRKEIKKSLTPSTSNKQIAFLNDRLDDYKEIINQSIMNGWTGLFEIKVTKSKQINLNQSIADDWANDDGDVFDVEIDNG